MYVVKEHKRRSKGRETTAYDLVRLLGDDGDNITFEIVGSWTGNEEGRQAAYDICRLMNDYAEFEA